MSPEQTKKTYALRGLGVSPGVVIGKAYLFDPLDSNISSYRLKKSSSIPKEIERFKEAMKESEKQLLEIQSKLKKTGVNEPLYIIDVHILILKDKKFTSRTIKYIRRMGINAEWAVRLTLDYYKEIFEQVGDAYIRERISDVQYVGHNILRNLSGEKREIILDIGGEVIVIAPDLSPADTAQMKMDKVIGFATDIGGKTSHPTIVSPAMDIHAACAPGIS